MCNPHAGQPFTTSDDEIADALLDVSIPTLMLSLVHMAGDPALIRGALKPAGLFLNEVQGYMSEEDKATARTIALKVISDYRDRGCPDPEPISSELLKEMMEWLVCEPVPDEYVPMLLEEMELDGADARAPRAPTTAARVTPRPRGPSGHALSTVRLPHSRHARSSAPWGQLDRPHLPSISGRDEFSGNVFHSAEWDHSVDLRGKRVAMIGAGASGFQIAPTIAEEVSHLTIFQRTAQWMFPNPNYHEAVGPGVQWALRHLPFYGRWYRFLLFWPGCDKGLEAARVDPDYPDQQSAVSEINEITRIMFTEWIKSQIGDDPELAARVVPDYPATGKRTLQDDGSWLQTLTREDVELIRTPIAHIEAEGVVTADGVRHPVDVIVFATGFQATEVLWPMTITGRDGQDLRGLWGQRPAAYLGITVPGYPNFFCMYGPGTNLASGGSLIFHSECQMRYISKCLDQLITGGHRSMEPRQDKTDDWVRRSQEEMRKMVWSQPSIAYSFYKNAHGEVYTLSPWRLVDYWTWTRVPEAGDFTFG